MDLKLMNKINPAGWVAINCISTSAHTIWGVLAGKLLLSNKTAKFKNTGTPYLQWYTSGTWFWTGLASYNANH